jgi:2-keto-4-pentenoate hydratase/2-oxohepta-3-ene-1,7-dioic acid hydratase in catechol pathway
LTEAKALAGKSSLDGKLDAINFLPVIPNPGKIICIGHNYKEHRIETQSDKTENSVLRHYALFGYYAVRAAQIESLRTTV